MKKIFRLINFITAERKTKREKWSPSAKRMRKQGADGRKNTKDKRRREQNLKT